MSENFKIRPTPLHRFSQYVPYSWLGTVRRSLRADNAQSLLDIGCGFGFPISVLKPPVSFSIGVDIFEPYVRLCKATNLHNEHVICDVRYLPFRDSSFDVVMCLEVIEHLHRVDGETLISDMETIAKSQIIISTPVGYQHQEEADNNPYMAHLSSWTVEDFSSRGFSVKTRGLKFRNDPHYGRRIWAILARILGNYVFGFLGAIFPSMSVQLVARKAPSAGL